MFEGHGSPEGVVRAHRGREYIDLDTGETYYKDSSYYLKTGWISEGEGAGAGGTDDAGNVYSIEFDPDADVPLLSLRCVGADGSVSIVSVGAGGFVFQTHSEDSSVSAGVLGTLLGGGGIAISSTGAILINGVTIDPGQPWPGG
jgi:hypothetical protein